MIEEFTKRRGALSAPVGRPVLTGRVVEKCGSLRPFPLGLPTRPVGHAGGVPLRPDHRDPEAARHGALRRVARGRARLHRRRHGGEAHERRADVGDVDAAAGGQRRAPPTTTPTSANRPRSPTSTGRTYVAAESMTAGSNAWAWCPATLKPTADKELAMGLNRFVIVTRAPRLQPARRQGPGPQPRFLSASGSRATRPGPKPASAWAHAPRPQLLPAAARPLRGRRPVLLRRRHERDRPLRRQGPAGAGRLQLRLRQRRCTPSCTCRSVGGRPARDTERHALSRARARSEQPAHVAARDSGRSGAGLSSAGAVDSGGLRSPWSTPSLSDDEAEFRSLADELCGTADRGRCRQDREGDRLGRRQPGGRPEAPGRRRPTSSTLEPRAAEHRRARRASTSP